MSYGTYLNLVALTLLSLENIILLYLKNHFIKEVYIMEIQDIIFLGGGASASEGAPTQANLFREYFLSNQEERNNRFRGDQRLKKFFNEFFGIEIGRENLERESFPTFEEILGILELSLKRGESFKGYRLTPERSNIGPIQENSSERLSIQQIREDLIFLIAAILERKLRRENERRYHKELVERLKDENKLLETCFISLNYDILIDNALEGFNGYGPDYGVEFTNSIFPPHVRRTSNAERNIPLYKLHGSLNWLYCPTCISLTLTPWRKGAAELAREPEECDTCGSFMVPIIIPPTFFKVMSNFYLQQVWHKAENVLNKARRIFFCGYSFPDADIHIKYLLKRAEVRNDFTPEVYIINEHDGKNKYQREDEKLRYKRFFKNRHRINYTHLSFENFCENGI
jgi:hypothetical protein